MPTACASMAVSIPFPATQSAQDTLLAAAQTDVKAALESLLPGATVTVTGIRNSAASTDTRRRLLTSAHTDRRRLSSHVTGSTIFDYTASYDPSTDADSAANPQEAVSTLLTASHMQHPVPLKLFAQRLEASQTRADSPNSATDI